MTLWEHPSITVATGSNVTTLHRNVYIIYIYIYIYIYMYHVGTKYDIAVIHVVVTILPIVVGHIFAAFATQNANRTI